MFKFIRVGILLIIFAGLLSTLLYNRSTLRAWDRTIIVAIHPIAADTRSETYVQNLQSSDFGEIENYFQVATKTHGYTIDQPVRIIIEPSTEVLQPPTIDPTSNIVSRIISSLKFRWWLWRQVDSKFPPAHLRLFVYYHDPETTPAVAHSFGFEKARAAVINVFSARRERGGNQVIIAHELLHLFGATDKYDLHTLQPVYPEGFAAPERQPLYPQQQAEIMGGRIAISTNTGDIPRSLGKTLIGPLTAHEVGLEK